MSTPAQPARPTKFNFDTVFGSNGASTGTQAGRPRSAYSADEVEAIRKETFAAGKASASAELAHMQAMALSSIAQTLGTLIQQFDGQISALRLESANLALAVGRKLAETALQASPQGEVVALISECMHKMHLESRLVIRVSPEIAEQITSHIQTLADRNGFSGRVIVLVEPSLSSSACRIEWADGGIEQDTSETFAAIQEQVARWQAARTGEENQS
ncbi:MAG: FliH/SctL family protein [Micropepsaceae bacterium]